MMLNQNKQYVNQFAGVINATSTVASTGVLSSTAAIDWGFNAALVKMVIDSGGPAYLRLVGNTASTSDYKLTSGDTLTDWYDIGVGLAGISITATSTGLSM